MTERRMELKEDKCRLCEIHGSATADHRCAEHMHYHAAAMSSNAAIAYKASLELLFAHVADIHTLMLKIIADKYGHSVEEMLLTVQSNPEWNNLYLHPTLKALTYFELPPAKQEEESTTLPTKLTLKRRKK